MAVAATIFGVMASLVIVCSTNEVYLTHSFLPVYLMDLSVAMMSEMTGGGGGEGGEGGSLKNFGNSSGEKKRKKEYFHTGRLSN